MNPRLDKLLNSFEGVKQTGDGQWEACCPVRSHDDNTPSLSIGLVGQKTLLHCQAGCSTSDVLKEVGMEYKDLFPNQGDSGKKIVATYDYRDADGTLLFQAVRYEPKDFRQRKPKPGGDWDWSVKGVKRVVYRLPELAKADESETIDIPEGEKDVDRLLELGLVATCNVGGANKWRASDSKYVEGRPIAILADNDKVGREHAQKVAKRCDGKASSIKVVELPGLPLKGDVSDWLDAGGTVEQLQEIVEATPEWEPSTGDVDPDDDRVEVAITTDEHIVNEAVANSLLSASELFQRSGRLVHITNDSQSESSDHIERTLEQPRIADVPIALLRDKIVSCVRFVRETDEGKNLAHPPDWCVKAIYAKGSWPGVRRLSGVATSPIFRPDGTILSEPGYDPATRLYMAGEVCRISVPENPSLSQAQAAIAFLLNVVGDFPFERPDHAAAWLALVLTPLARHAFEGPAPLHLIDANVPGSGKSLLADLASIIVQGRNVARMNNPRDDEEANKVITSLVIAGDPLILIDNIVGGLGCASLDAALTGTTWRDRLLGKNELVELPLLATWAATGNNVVLRADTSRRVLHVRLQSPLERPETRTGFKYPNVRQYAVDHRGELLTAALTVLRAFIVAGRPSQKLPPWGSFEGWSDLVRQALVWAGQPDPAATRQELVESGDREILALRAVIDCWPSVDSNNKGLTSRQILDVLKGTDLATADFRDAMLELCPPPGSATLPTIRQLGNKLGHARGRVVRGRAISYREGRGRARSWYVSQLDSPNSSHPVSESPESPAIRNGDSGVSGDSYTSTREESKKEEVKKEIHIGGGADESHHSHQSHHSPSETNGTATLPVPESPESPAFEEHVF